MKFCTRYSKPGCACTLLAIFGLILLFQICKKTNKSDGDVAPGEGVKKNDKSAQPLVSDYIFWRLPLNSWYNHYNVGLGPAERITDDRCRATCELLQRTGAAFLKENSVDLTDPCATFFVDRDLKVIGITLLTSEDASYDYRPPGQVGDWVRRGWGPLSCRSYDIKLPLGQATGAGTRVRSLDFLRGLGRIDFIDFGLAGFSDGVWDSLARTAPAVALKGLVVFRAKEMLAVRHGHVVPEIAGLVVHVSSIEHLREYGLAFPNLNSTKLR